MKAALIGLIILLAAFVVMDVARIMVLWSDYQPQNILVHFSFALIALVIVGSNAYFIKLGNNIKNSSIIKLLISFIAQIAISVLLATSTLLAWKGCGSCATNEAKWFGYQVVGLLLILVLFLVGLIFWSKRLCSSSK